MNKINVAYIIYNDRPTSGLIQTQVLSLLSELKTQNAQLQLTLLAFWHPLIAWKARKEIAALKTQLSDADVNVVNIPFAIIPGRYFLDSTRLFPFLYFWTTILFIIMLRRGYDIVHARGYFASYVAAKLAASYGYKTVFDMRSLWPKEHVSIGAWQPDDRIYQMWERIESETIELSDVSVAINRPMGEEVVRLNSQARVAEIPICVDIDLFRPITEDRDRLRAELGWEDNFVIGYHGSLGLENRNITEIANYFALISKSVPNTRLLILTANQTVDISLVMGQAGVEPGTYAVRHPSQRDIPVWFSAVEVGMHAMSPGPDAITRMSVKVVEYFSCGLPVIVNPYVGAAAEIIEREQLGVVLDGSEEDSVIKAAFTRLMKERDSFGARSRQLAEAKFSVAACASQYADVYSSITEQ